MPEIDTAAIDRINETATFYPQTDEYSTPCLEVAGVQVYVYLTEKGTLRVSLDFDEADSRVFSDGANEWTVPVEVTASGVTVWTAD